MPTGDHKGRPYIAVNRVALTLKRRKRIMATAQPNVRVEFEPQRFNELVVYIADLCRDDPTFGVIKLNKILYFSDFAAYRILGKPITGATYFRLAEGPAPRQFLQAGKELAASGRIEIVQRPYFNGVEKRVTVIGAPANPEEFSVREREIVQSVARFFEGKTAREVSDFSRLEPGWIAADDHEDIPYETAWLSSDPPDQLDEAVARAMAAEYDASLR